MTDKYRQYLQAVKGAFTKVVRVDFLQPNGTVAFSVGSLPERTGVPGQVGRGPYGNGAGALVQSGWIRGSANSGMRRQASVTLDNTSGRFSWQVNRVWFGTRVRLMEGLVLPDGESFLLPQGVFEITNPREALRPGQNTVTWQLQDKWACLDGTLSGVLEGDYVLPAGSDLLQAMAALLRLDRYTLQPDGSSPIDPAAPSFPVLYSGRVQTLTDGRQVPVTQAPCDLRVEAGKTLADVLLGMASMLGAGIGYDPCGRLTLTACGEDVDPASGPVLWRFSPEEPQLLGVQVTAENTGVTNDVIALGGALDGLTPARGRAENLDPASPCCIQRIGRKTRHLSLPDVYSDSQCRAMAQWTLEQCLVPARSVSLSCSQLFHLREFGRIVLTGGEFPSPVSLQIRSFTCPLSSAGEMTLETAAL